MQQVFDFARFSGPDFSHVSFSEPDFTSSHVSFSVPDFSHVSHNSSDVDSFVGVSTTAHSSKEPYLLPHNISKPKPVTDVVRRGDQVKGVAQFIEAEGNGAGQPGRVPTFQRVVSRNLFLFNGATPGEVTPLPRPLKLGTMRDSGRDYPRPSERLGCIRLYTCV